GGEVHGVPPGQPPVLLSYRGTDDIDDHSTGHRTIVADGPRLPEIWRCVRFPTTTLSEQHRRGTHPMDRPMDLHYTDTQEAFRAEARAWLSAHVPAPRSLPSLDTAEGFEAHRA